MESDDRARIAEHWNKRTTRDRPAKTRWYESRRILQHVNQRIDGVPLERNGEALIRRAKRVSGGKTYEVGVSVGCGTGGKEMRLLNRGLVGKFILFELSEERIKKGMARAQKLGLEDRVEFRSDDAFSAFEPDSVDFVHWHGSLHHMMDVDMALRWSREVLRSGGMFYMNDFVGPSRWQWSDANLALVNRVRAMLPQRYLRNPNYPERAKTEFIDREVKRGDPEKLIALDPSEAADSGRIMSCLETHWPEAEVTALGGVIYQLAMRQIISNFDEDDETDLALLESLLLIDELSIGQPDIEVHYAAALAIKP